MKTINVLYLYKGDLANNWLYTGRDASEVIAQVRLKLASLGDTLFAGLGEFAAGMRQDYLLETNAWTFGDCIDLRYNNSGIEIIVSEPEVNDDATYDEVWADSAKTNNWKAELKSTYLVDYMKHAQSMKLVPSPNGFRHFLDETACTEKMIKDYDGRWGDPIDYPDDYDGGGVNYEDEEHGGFNYSGYSHEEQLNERVFNETYGPYE